MNNIINKLAEKPSRLFLIDGAGAFITAFMLFIILKHFNEYFRIAETTLIYLSGIALVLCIYSITCFLLLKDNWVLYIKLIGFANLGYCILTCILLITHHSTITAMGITYFLAETTIVVALVFVEFRVANLITEHQNTKF